MPGPKTNEREGTRAVLRHTRVSPSKAREVLNLIRGKPVQEAVEILRFSERDVAIMVGKLLASAIANAEKNDGQDPEELYVSACFADEGTTIKRWRPRARGRATRIRKRTSHVTVIVSRLPEDQLARLQVRRQAEQSLRRARRVAGARKSAAGTAAAGGTPARSRLGRRRAGAARQQPAAEETAAEESAAAEVAAGEEEAAAEELAAAEEAAAVETAAAEEQPAELMAQQRAETGEEQTTGKTEDGAGDQGAGGPDDTKGDR
jgi:large subunit ribosomal protein L22